MVDPKPVPNAQSKVIPGRTVIGLLNQPLLRRLFLVNNIEEIVEFTIQNQTVLVKIIDKVKVAKAKKQLVLPANKRVNVDKKYALGRTNALKVTTVIAIINSNTDLKARLGVPKGHEVVNLLMYGVNLTVNTVDKIVRTQRDNQLQQELE